MTSFEFAVPFLVLGLFLATGAVLFFALRIERRLADRKNVNLSNYREKNYLFYITHDFTVAVMAGLVGVLALVLSVIALFHPVVRIYVIPLVLLLGANGFSAYFALSRPKFTRDIRVFDAYYVRVCDMIAGKSRTQADIDACQYRVRELAQKLAATLKEFNKNLTVPIAGDFLQELFAPIRTMLEEYAQEIESFSGAIEEDFNRAIADFLQNETEPELRVVPVRALDEGTVDELLAEIKTAYAACVAERVLPQIDSGAVTDARALGNVMALFHKLGIKVDADTLARILRAAAVFEDRSVLARMLYENKQIPARAVCEVLIPEEMEWAFVPGMAAAFNTRELTEILCALLAADRRAMSYTLLSQFTGAHRTVLQGALRVQSERTANAPLNAAAREAKAFLLILDADYAVGNAGNLYENLALILCERAEELGFDAADTARIRAIVDAERFWQERTYISECYQAAAARLAPLAESTTRILLQYVTDPTDKADFLSSERLAALLGEYRFTLCRNALDVMRMLLCGRLLSTTADETVRAAVLHELREQPSALALSADVGDGVSFGRALLAHLVRKERVELRSVIYRTENARRVLDAVKALADKDKEKGKGE